MYQLSHTDAFGNSDSSFIYPSDKKLRLSHPNGQHMYMSKICHLIL